MNFTQFLEQFTKEQVNAWWQNAPENAPDQVEKDNWKYRLKKNGKTLPFKWTIVEIANYYNLDFTAKNFESNLSTRDRFCEKFDFEIEEALVYDTTEEKNLKALFQKFKDVQGIFQKFIAYAHQIIVQNKVEPYKIRIAIGKSDKEAMIIIGKRNALCFREAEGKARIGFIVSDTFINQFNTNLNFKTFLYSNPDNGKALLRIDVASWEEIPEDLLESNKQVFASEYNRIKDDKISRWNLEASTTNSALKYVVFENIIINEWLNTLNIEKMNRFKKIIEELKISIKKDKRIIKDFKFKRITNSYTWIVDHIDKIGTQLAHYEIMHTSKSMSVELHFEDKEQYKKDIFIQELKVLPHGFKWNQWNQFNTQKIVLEKRINFDSPTTIDELKDAIFLFESNFGNQVRRIMAKVDNKNIRESNILKQIDELESEFKLFLKGYGRTTIPTYAKNFKDYLVSYATRYSKIKFDRNDFLNFTKVTSSEYAKYVKFYTKGVMSFVNFFKTKLMPITNNPLNQILYGPPGTGKTYKTKQLAVEIITGEKIEDRTKLTEEYNKLRDAGQIVFTTFHQSMSYEDFVEGIKPKTENEQVIYEVEDGIFKELCLKAEIKSNTNFNEAYERLIKQFSENDNDYLVLKTPRNKEYRVNLNSNNNLSLFTSDEIKHQGTLTKNKLEKHFIDENAFKGWEGYAKGVIDYLIKKF